MNFKVNKLTVDDFYYFYHNMRAEDRLEWWYASGISFEDTAISEFKDALCLYDADTGTVYAIGGIEGNIIWVVCTELVDLCPLSFLRFCKPFFKQWVTHPVTNYVWMKNIKHMKWLKWLGAKFCGYAEINGQPFQKFILEPVKE